MAEDTTFNGWKNWTTWNVALWLGNDESLYDFASRFVHYKDLAHALEDAGTPITPDGANYNDADLDTYALDEWLWEEFQK
jgi:hypothetical protein